MSSPLGLDRQCFSLHREMDRRRLSAFETCGGSARSMAYANQANTDQRRLSDGPHPLLLNRPYPYHQYPYPDEFLGSQSCMLKRKNSSLNILLDSTSSMMRTASNTLQCFIGSARRASYCGQPDPSVQLSPHGNCGSLYLRTTTDAANESSSPHTSYDEQRRRVTIYDGRVPSTPRAPKIPFELMTPIDAITQARDDPVESFVQIVLEAPDDRPLMMSRVSSSSSSSTQMDLISRRRPRSSSPTLKSNLQRPTTAAATTTLSPTPATNASHSSRDQQPSGPVEPMDFSFLEPVLRGESAAPPPHLIVRQHSSHASHGCDSSTTEDSAIDLPTSSRSSYSSNRMAAMEDDLTSPESLSGDNHHYEVPIPSSRTRHPTTWT